MPKLQGLIFDLDGTLVDSAPDLRHALNLTLKAHGRRELTMAEVTPLLGDGMLPMLSRAFAMTGKSIPDTESFTHFQEFITHYRTLPPLPEQIYPQGTETLKKYKDAGIALGLCTNKQETATLRVLDGLGLLPLFDFVAGGDTFPLHKPNPAHVTGVIERLGVPASSCAMIGDSTNDVLAAHGAGIPCLVVTHGYGMNLDELGGDALISGFNQLEAALTKLGYTLA